MRFAVCIPTIRPDTLGHAVASIRRQTFTDWELMVVGQGDEPALREAVRAAAAGDPRVSYLHLDRRGASAARNAGLDATTGEIVVFMDDDCVARDDCLAAYDTCFEPHIDFVSGEVTAPPRERHLFATCPEVHPGEVVFDPATSPDSDRLHLLGANIAVRRTAAERVGGFDECFGPGTRFAGTEEHDYAARLVHLGVTMRSTSTASVEHTYGYRYGLGSYYRHRRDRLGADGGFGAKMTMLREPGTIRVGPAVRTEIRSQLTTLKLTRLPNNAFRLVHYIRAYRDCLRDYELTDGNRDPVTAVLQRRG